MVHLLGIRAYARRRGVHHNAVQKAIQSGRLSASVSRDAEGQVRIDADLADREWNDNTDRAQQRDRKPQGRGERRLADGGDGQPPPPPRGSRGQTAIESPPAALALPGPTLGQSSAGDPGAAPTGGPSFNQSRAVREAYRAKTERVRYELLVGSVVRADEVRAQAFQVARVVRDALLNIPHRIAAELAATTSVHQVHQILIRELNGALAELVNEGRRN